MKNIFVIICFLVGFLGIQGNALPASISTSLIGTGEFAVGIPVMDTGLIAGFSGNGNYAFQVKKDKEACPSTKFFIDNIPVFGGMETDLILTNSKVTNIGITKNFGYKLTKDVDIGISVMLVNLDITDGAGYFLIANPYIGVNLNF